MLQLHMIPASGDATLLRFYEGENEVNILIDGGNKKNNCVDYLKKLRIKCIDLLIASHLDEDHIRGLRRVAEEIDVKSLWRTDISPLIRPAIELNSIYMMKCLFETSLIVDGRGVRGANKPPVYEGYKQQIGPFYLQVLSPPESLHNYLRRPDAVKKILKSNKGKTIKNYVRNQLEEMTERSEKEGRDEVKRKEEITSKIVEPFEVEFPQKEDIKNRIEKDDYDLTHWREDKYYDSARSLFNDISIVVSITYNYHGMTKQFLFPGDLTNWSLVLAKYPQLIRNRILKVPHHGSDIYFDREDYEGILFEKYFDHDFWRRLPQPHHYLWEDWLYLSREILRSQIPPLFPTSFGIPIGTLPAVWNNTDIYEWLAPKRALIYPFTSRELPKLSVRNQIINASMATSCTFKQRRVENKTYEPSDPCFKCYNCTEIATPIIFEWKEKEEC